MSGGVTLELSLALILGPIGEITRLLTQLPALQRAAASRQGAEFTGYRRQLTQVGAVQAKDRCGINV